MEYRGNASHPFAVTCVRNNIDQFYLHYPTVDQRERGMRNPLLMDMWYDKFSFRDSEHWQNELCRFVNFYSTVKSQ